MTIWYGGTVADFTVGPSGQLLPNATFPVYLDTTLTVPATDLVNEAGTPTGGNVTSRASGVYRFGRPDGTTGPVYVSDGAGGYVAIYPAGAGSTPATPVVLNEFNANGNSLTAQGNANGPKWVDGVAADLGLTPVNNGVSGRGSTEIAIAMGAFDPQLTLPNNVVPATGSVTATMVSSGVWRPQVTTWNVRAAGVPCVLSHDAGSGADPTNPDSPVGVFTFTLTRVTPGTAVAFPPGTTVHCTDNDAHKGARVTSIWTLTNNPATDPTIALGLRDVDLMVAWANPNRWVVMTEHLRTNESQTTAKKQINAILRQRFPLPGQIVDLEAIIGGWAIVCAGVNATSDDLVALSLGQAPPSIMSDTGSVKTHFNAAGYGVVRQSVTQALATQGAIPGLYPAVKPTVVGAAPTSSAATTSGFTAAVPAAVANATAYHWEYRRPGTTAWFYGPNSTGLTAVFNSLDPGTTYEIRYTPASIAGLGTPSAVGTATSAGTPATVLATDAGTGAAVTNISGRSTDQAVASRTGGSAKAYTVSNNFTGKNSDGTGLGGQFYLSGGSSSIAQVDLAAANHSVEVTVDVLPTSGTTALILAYSDSSNYLMCTIASNGVAQLRKVVAGTATVLQTSAPGTLPASSRVQGFKSVNGLFLKIGGLQVLTSTDSDVAALTGTRAGFQVSPGVRLRDIVFSDK